MLTTLVIISNIFNAAAKDYLIEMDTDPCFSTFLTLYGDQGSIPEIPINAANKPFQMVFTLSNMTDVGDLEKVSVRYDDWSWCFGSELYLDSIKVNGKVANFNRWVDAAGENATANFVSPTEWPTMSPTMKSTSPTISQPVQVVLGILLAAAVIFVGRRALQLCCVSPAPSACTLSDAFPCCRLNDPVLTDGKVLPTATLALPSSDFTSPVAVVVLAPPPPSAPSAPLANV